MPDTDTFFHKYAADFNAIYGNDHSFVQRLINKYFRKCMRIRFELTMRHCEPIHGATILDVGCGPGHYAVSLAKKGAGHVHGIDFAPNMIQFAKQRAQQSHVSQVCTFEVKDFMDLPDDPYDFCVVMGFMDYMENPVEIIAKVNRLTKNKAFISFPVSGGILAWQRKIRYRNRCPLFLFSKEDVVGIMMKAGVRSFRIEKIDRDFFVEISNS